ncbi:MAG: helix-turn-helix domain-containing protein [Solirubrobacterales bacterium]
MNLRNLPPTLTVEQTGELLGISRYAAYQAAATGELPVLRLGRRLLVPTPRLLAMLGLENDMAQPPTEVS